MPAELVDEKTIWEERYRSINDLESHLCRNGTRILKFFLHVSREEQRQRFLARLDEPEKNWKFGAGDLAERALWDEYMAAYRSLSPRHEQKRGAVVRHPGGRQEKHAPPYRRSDRRDAQRLEDVLSASPTRRIARNLNRSGSTLVNEEA